MSAAREPGCERRTAVHAHTISRRRKDAPGMDVNELSSQKISRRAVMRGLGAGGAALAFGGILLIEGCKGRDGGASPLGAATRVPRSAALVGTTVYTYHGHTDVVNAASWSPTSVRIASASGEGHVWDGTTGGHVVKYKGHTGAINALAWSPAGTHIVSAGEDG